jgi:hypothetical protein
MKKTILVIPVILFSCFSFAQKQKIKIASSGFNLGLEAQYLESKVDLSGFRGQYGNGYYVPSDNASEESNRVNFAAGIRTEWFPGKKNQRWAAIITGLSFMRHGFSGRYDPSRQNAFLTTEAERDVDLVFNSIKMPLGGAIYLMLGQKSQTSISVSFTAFLMYLFKATEIDKNGNVKKDIIDQMETFTAGNMSFSPTIRYKRIYLRYDFAFPDSRQFFKNAGDYSNSFEAISGLALGFFLKK